MADDRPIILFDGVCHLCDGITRFIIRRDPPPPTFRFAPLQSDAGRRLLAEHDLPLDDMDTFVLIEGGRAYTRSTAGLRTVRHLGFPWSWLYAFIIVPRPLRDLVYRIIAKNRYRWFGKRDSCMMPDEQDRDRFIEDGPGEVELSAHDSAPEPV